MRRRRAPFSHSDSNWAARAATSGSSPSAAAQRGDGGGAPVLQLLPGGLTIFEPVAAEARDGGRDLRRVSASGLYCRRKPSTPASVGSMPLFFKRCATSSSGSGGETGVRPVKLSTAGSS